jgi:hypothetical protein
MRRQTVLSGGVSGNRTSHSFSAAMLQRFGLYQNHRLKQRLAKKICPWLALSLFRLPSRKALFRFEDHAFDFHQAGRLSQSEPSGIMTEGEMGELRARGLSLRRPYWRRFSASDHKELNMTVLRSTTEMFNQKHVSYYEPNDRRVEEIRKTIRTEEDVINLKRKKTSFETMQRIFSSCRRFSPICRWRGVPVEYEAFGSVMSRSKFWRTHRHNFVRSR